jgi:hypothetical protein
MLLATPVRFSTRMSDGEGHARRPLFPAAMDGASCFWLQQQRTIADAAKHHGFASDFREKLAQRVFWRI